MRFRFRYLNPDGTEVEVDDLEALRQHVQDGRLTEEMLLYDALTQEWSPARSHSIFHLVVEDMGEEDSAPTESDEPAKGSEASADADLPDMPVTLSGADAALSEEEAVEALLREREREEQGRESGPSLRVDAFSNLRSWSDDPAEPPAGGRTSRRAPGDGGGGRGGAIQSGRGSSIRAATGAASSSPGTRPAPSDTSEATARTSGHRRRIHRPRKIFVQALVLVAAGALGYLALQARAEAVPSPDGAPLRASASVGSAPSPRPVPAGPGFAASEDAAFAHMITGMDSLAGAYRVERVPQIWLQGPYLADAAGYPGVQAYWERYERFVSELRQRDTALFRSSYVDDLRRQGVSTSVVSLRLAQAVSNFEATQPQRDSMYHAMEDLAVAALTLHDLLIQRSTEISHDPTTRTRASRDPILHVAVADSALRGSIWALVERLGRDLERVYGEELWDRGDLARGMIRRIGGTDRGPGTDPPR